MVHAACLALSAAVRTQRIGAAGVAAAAAHRAGDATDAHVVAAIVADHVVCAEPDAAAVVWAAGASDFAAD